MFSEERIEQANAMCAGTLMETLGIRFVPAGAQEVVAVMPVGPRTYQPMGQLHGGATVALAESVGSVGSHLLLDDEQRAVVGIEVNANHLRAVRSGQVRASGRLVHQGRSTHVWEVRVTDDQERLVAVGRITNLIIERR